VDQLRLAPSGTVDDALQLFQAGPATHSEAGRVPAVVVRHARVPLTRLVTPWARYLIRRSLRRSPVRLNLGSGFAPKDGWTNIDLLGAPGVIPWDLALGIPYPDGSVDAVFHEHVVEHLPFPAALQLTRECRRVLKPGGVLRFGVPDAEGVIRSYAGQINPAWALSRPTPMLAVNSLFYENGHVAMYDVQTLEYLCRAAGFANAERAFDGESRIDPCPDSPGRFGSAWVEATA
jgi:predicted SAM-dependent methyltransferase